jgi:hypothetical protein
MPTSHTRTTLYNRALDHISEFPINSPQDDSAYARWLNRNFTPTVEAALRLDVWNFACRFVEVTEELTPPIMRWRRQFQLPLDSLRILQPTKDGYRNGYPLAWAVQGGFLLMNDVPTKGIEYIKNIQNPGEWDPLFAEMVAAQLAAGMAQRFTAKNSYLDRAVQLANQAKDQASEINAFEGSLPQPDQHDILRARDDTYYDDSWRGERRGW